MQTQTPPTPLSQRFAKSHAFLVGTDHYEHIQPLETAVNDVEAIAGLLADAPHAYDVSPPLIDASFEELCELIESTMPKMVGPNDRVLFYFAGHGVATEVEGDKAQGFLLPRDVSEDNMEKALPMERLLQAFEQLQCKHFLLVLDCCFSGAARWSDIRTRTPLVEPRKVFRERFDRFVTDPAWQVITSSAHDQKAIDVIGEQAIGKRGVDQSGHSPFAWQFMEGLKGKADLVPKDNPNGLITATELYIYLRDHVENQTIELEERLRQTPSFFPLKKHDKGEYLFLSPKHPLNLPHFDPAKNPYKGLYAYEQSDRELFFGRERVIAEALEKTAQRNFIILSGASGSGKSSLAKAGLLPALADQGYDIISMRPGEQPMKELRKAIPEVTWPDEQEKTILFIDQMEETITRCRNRRERQAFTGRLKQLIDTSNGSQKVLITIRSDFEPQFEELALGTFWAASRYVVPPFLPEEIREVIVQPALQNVLYFEPPGLVDTITNEVLQAPGALPLLSFTLSGLFLEYVHDGLLENRTLTLAYYNRLGGVSGSLRRQADRAYESLDLPHQKVMRKILLRMVSLEGVELVSRRAYMEELIYSDEAENKAVTRVVSQLVQARLIVQDSDGGRRFVEPAHDALIRAWGRLWEWTDAFKEDFPLRDRLVNALQDYQKNKGEKNFEKYLLHEDPRLDRLEQIRQASDSWMNEAEAKFVKESFGLREKKQKKQRRNLVGVIIALSVFGIAATVFGFQSNRNAKLAEFQAQIARDSTLAAEEQRHKAEVNLFEAERQQCIAEDSTLAAQQQRSLYQGQLVVSERERQRAENNERDAELQRDSAEMERDRALSQARIAENRRLVSLALQEINDKNHNDAVDLLLAARQLNLSPNPELQFAINELFTNSEAGQILIRTDEKFVHETKKLSGVLSPDKKYLLSFRKSPKNKFPPPPDRKVPKETCMGSGLSESGLLKMWSVNDREVISTKSLDIGVRDIQFISDDTFIVFFWRTPPLILDRQMNTIVDFKNKKGIGSGGYGELVSDGQYIMLRTKDHRLLFYRLNGDFISQVQLGQYTFEVNFNKDGQYFITDGPHFSTALWSITGELIKTWKANPSHNQYAFFFPDGQRVVTISTGKKPEIWNTDGQLLDSIDQVQHSFTCQIYFYPDNNRFLAVNFPKENINTIWDAEGEYVGFIRNESFNSNNNSTFFIEGNKIVNCGFDGLTLYSSKGKLLKKMNEDQVTKFGFSPDGEYFFTASRNRVQIWDKAGNPKADLGILGDLGYAGFNDDPLKFSFSTDSKKLVINASEVVSIWDIDGNLLGRYDKPCYGVEEIDFLPNENGILMNGEEYGMDIWRFFRPGTVKWNARNGTIPDSNHIQGNGNVTSGSTYLSIKPLRLWNSKGELLRKIPANQYSRILKAPSLCALTSKSGGQLLDLERNITYPLDNFSKDPSRIVANPELKRIIGFYPDHSFDVWDYGGEHLLQSPALKNPGLLKPINHLQGCCIFISPKINKLLTVDGTDAPKLLNLEDLNWKTLKGHPKLLTSADFSDDGKWLLTGGWNGKVILWNEQTSIEFENQAFPLRVEQVRISGNGEYLMAHTQDSIKIWNRKGKVKISSSDIDIPVSDITNSNFLLDGTFFHIVQGKGVQVFDLEGNLITNCQKVIRSPSDRYFYTQHQTSNKIEVWDKNGQLVNSIKDRRLSGPANGLFDTATRTFTDDGDLFLTRDGKKVFELRSADGALKWTKANSNELEKVGFSDTGRYIFSYYKNTFFLWSRRGELLAAYKGSRESHITRVDFSARDEAIIINSNNGEITKYLAPENILVFMDELGSLVPALNEQKKEKYKIDQELINEIKVTVN